VPQRITTDPLIRAIVVATFHSLVVSSCGEKQETPCRHRRVLRDQSICHHTHAIMQHHRLLSHSLSRDEARQRDSFCSIQIQLRCLSQQISSYPIALLSTCERATQRIISITFTTTYSAFVNTYFRLAYPYLIPRLSYASPSSLLAPNDRATISVMKFLGHQFESIDPKPTERAAILPTRRLALTFRGDARRCARALSKAVVTLSFVTAPRARERCVYRMRTCYRCIIIILLNCVLTLR